jgi:hypothetical protein
MKTIHQLAKISRRLRRITAHSMRKLIKGKERGAPLTTARFNYHQQRISVAHDGVELLKRELLARNVGETPYRDCTPHKQRPVKLSIAA